GETQRLFSDSRPLCEKREALCRKRIPLPMKTTRRESPQVSPSGNAGASAILLRFAMTVRFCHGRKWGRATKLRQRRSGPRGRRNRGGERAESRRQPKRGRRWG